MKDDIYLLRRKSDAMYVKSGGTFCKNKNRIYKNRNIVYKNDERYIDKNNTFYNNEESSINNKNRIYRNRYDTYTRSRYDERQQKAESRQAGFDVRSIISLCCIIAFVMCRLGNTEQSEYVFAQITSGVSVNQSLHEMKNTVVEKIQNLFDFK